jgi:hypothetical protein
MEHEEIEWERQKAEIKMRTDSSEKKEGRDRGERHRRVRQRTKDRREETLRKRQSGRNKREDSEGETEGENQRGDRHT